MGSGLTTRRGMLRKPAECKPPPPPPFVPPTCLCLLSVRDDPFGLALHATFSVQSILWPAETVIIAGVSSAPALLWPAPAGILNDGADHSVSSTPPVPGTWYSITVEFIFPSGSTCSAHCVHYAP